MNLTVKIAGESHDFDLAKITFGEAKALEQATGATMVEFGGMLQRGSMTAMQVLLWLVQRRSNPNLRLADLDGLGVDDIDVVPVSENAMPWVAPGPTQAGDAPADSPSAA